MNKQLRDELAVATSYFEELQKMEDGILTEQAKIAIAATEAQEERDRRNSIPGLMYIIGTIAFFVFLAFVAVGLLLAAFNDAKYFCGALRFSIPVVIGYFLRIIGKKIESTNEKAYKEKLSTDVKPIADEANQNIESIKQIMDDFINQNSHYVEIIPTKYRNLESVSYMYLAAVDGRADTLKEAINLYEEQLHRWKLEISAQQAAEAQAYTAQAIEELGRQQAETNNHLRAIEFMEYMKYINEKDKY